MGSMSDELTDSRKRDSLISWELHFGQDTKFNGSILPLLSLYDNIHDDDHTKHTPSFVRMWEMSENRKKKGPSPSVRFATYFLMPKSTLRSGKSVVVIFRFSAHSKTWTIV